MRRVVRIPSRDRFYRIYNYHTLSLSTVTLSITILPSLQLSHPLNPYHSVPTSFLPSLNVSSRVAADPKGGALAVRAREASPPYIHHVVSMNIIPYLHVLYPLYIDIMSSLYLLSRLYMYYTLSTFITPSLHLLFHPYICLIVIPC